MWSCIARIIKCIQSDDSDHRIGLIFVLRKLINAIMLTLLEFWCASVADSFLCSNLTWCWTPDNEWVFIFVESRLYSKLHCQKQYLHIVCRYLRSDEWHLFGSLVLFSIQTYKQIAFEDINSAVINEQVWIADIIWYERVKPERMVAFINIAI